MGIPFGPPGPPEPPMTEEEWLADQDPGRMFSFALWRSQRKLTLARAAQHRLVWHKLSEKCRAAVEVQEAVAEGLKDLGALNPYLAARSEAASVLFSEGNIEVTAFFHE